MKKLFLSILTIVCLLVTLTVLNAVPVSAGTLTITPTVGGPGEPPGQEEPPPGQEEPPPGPVLTPIVVEIPERAGEDLSGVAERNPILEYVIDPMPPPGPQL
jgi:hypothetical protein